MNVYIYAHRYACLYVFLQIHIMFVFIHIYITMDSNFLTQPSSCVTYILKKMSNLPLIKVSFGPHTPKPE